MDTKLGLTNRNESTRFRSYWDESYNYGKTDGLTEAPKPNT